MTASTKPLVLEAADVTVTVDRFGREVVVIPDGVATALAAAIQDGWQESKGLAYGESRRFEPGTWVYDTTVTVLTVFAASPVPAQLADGDEGWQAVRDRVRAQAGWDLYPSIVGASGWDFETANWLDYEHTRDLRVTGSVHRRGTAYRYEG